MLALRTARPKWNHKKLYGPIATLWFFIMEKSVDQKEESEPPPEWPSLCGNRRQRFVIDESDWLLADFVCPSIPLTK